jgi:hypothetical protein
MCTLLGSCVQRWDRWCEGLVIGRVGLDMTGFLTRTIGARANGPAWYEVTQLSVADHEAAHHY